MLNYKVTDLVDIPSAVKAMEMLESLRIADYNKTPGYDALQSSDQEEIAAVCRDVEAGEYCIESLISQETKTGNDTLMTTDQVYYMHMCRELYEDIGYIGNVYGRFAEESGSFYAFSKENDGVYDITAIGLIVPEELYYVILNTGHVPEGYSWFGANLAGEWCLNKADDKLSPITLKDTFSFITKAFSRNAGLIETDIMMGKTAIIIGQGSVGSYVSMQLVKAGVGRFVLIDGDTLEIHNLSRHWLSLKHIGEYKVNAMRHEILQVNPFADVKVHRGIVQNAPEDLFNGIVPGEGIVIATGDNRECAAVANLLAERLNLPFVAVGCWQRAGSGEVFTWMKDSGLPLYGDAFEGLISPERNDAHRMYLGEEKDAESIHFQPGIYVDITFVTDIAVKLALDMMNRNTDEYIPRVYEDLSNYTLICNTNKTELGGGTACLFPYPLFISGRENGIWLEKSGQAAELTFDFTKAGGGLSEK